MDDSKLNRLREELKAARKGIPGRQRSRIGARYNEAEKVCVYGSFDTNMTPEQLAELIRSAESGIPVPGILSGSRHRSNTYRGG